MLWGCLGRSGITRVTGELGRFGISSKAFVLKGETNPGGLAPGNQVSPPSDLSKARSLFLSPSNEHT